MRCFEVLICWATLLSGSAVSLWSQTSPPHGDGARRALIIVNMEYKNLPWTPVDSSGAKALEEALRDASFTVSVKQDLDQESIKEVLDGFASSVRSGDIVLLYYSGYMKHEEKNNYLIPVNFDPASESKIYNSAYDLARFLDGLTENKPHLSMLMLDASWDTPRLSNQAGLTQPAPPSGTWIFASAEADQVTTGDQITSGKVGFFTDAVVKALPQHGLDLTELVPKVRADVELASKDTQHPASWSSDPPRFLFHEADPSGEKVNGNDRLRYVHIPRSE